MTVYNANSYFDTVFLLYCSSFPRVKQLKSLVCGERQRMNHCTNIHLRGESFANGLSVEMVLRFHSFLSAVSKRHPSGVKNCFFLFAFKGLLANKCHFQAVCFKAYAMTNSKTRVLVESRKLCLGYVGAGLNLDIWPVGKTVY